MRTIFNITKNISLYCLTAILLISCAKEELELDPIMCNQVTLHITNNLDDEIVDLSVEGVSIGTLAAGETYNELCLDQVSASSGIYPFVSLMGTYKDQVLGEDIYFCGVGLVTVDNAVYHIQVNDATDSIFLYESN